MTRDLESLKPTLEQLTRAAWKFTHLKEPEKTIKTITFFLDGPIPYGLLRNSLGIESADYILGLAKQFKFIEEVNEDLGESIHLKGPYFQIPEEHLESARELVDSCKTLYNDIANKTSEFRTSMTRE